MQWTQDNLRRLVKLYNKYNISSYNTNLNLKNRKKRGNCMQKICVELESFVPKITVEKIYSIVNHYRNIFKNKSNYLDKINKEKQSGFLTEETYKEKLELLISFYGIFKKEGIIREEFEELLKNYEKKPKEDSICGIGTKRKLSNGDEIMRKKQKLDTYVLSPKESAEDDEVVEEDVPEEEPVEEIKRTENQISEFHQTVNNPNNVTYEVIDLVDESIYEKKNKIKICNVPKNIAKDKENATISIDRIKKEKVISERKNSEETCLKEMKNIENNTVHGNRWVGDDCCDSSSLTNEPDDLWLTLMIRRYRRIKNPKTKLQLQRGIDEIIYKALDGET